MCSFYIHSKSDVNTISDLIRVEKYVDNNIQIFYLLWGLILKILIGKYCEDSAWAECLKLYDKKKSSKWFCLVCQKIIAMTTDSVVCERYLKWNHSSCAFLKNYRNLILQNWIWKLVLEIVQNEVYKVQLDNKMLWHWRPAPNIRYETPKHWLKRRRKDLMIL